MSRGKLRKVSGTGRDLSQPGVQHSCPCSAGGPVSKLVTVCPLAQAAAVSGQREAAALLRVPPALPDLCWPQPVPRAAGPDSEADEVNAWGWSALPGECPTPSTAGACGSGLSLCLSRQGEASGLAGLPAGEEQAQYHHGVIPISAAGNPA